MMNSEDQSVAVEIKTLHMKIRMSTKDKERLQTESQDKIRKQRAAVAQLTLENRQLKSDLNDARTANSEKADKSSLTKICQLNEKIEVVTSKIHNAQIQEDKMEDRMSKVAAELKKVRLEMAERGGSDCATQEKRKTQSKISILENRLDRAVQQFNDAVHHNKELRCLIDSLRAERITFDRIYKNMENQLEQKKSEMANIIEQANNAYEARDIAQTQMVLLKQQADKEHVDFEREWKELGKLIENDKKMKEFMRNKQQQEQQEKRHQVRRQQTSANVETAKPLEEEPLDKAQLEKFKADFVRIQQATGFTDIDTLTGEFLKAEDENFRQFTFNNEQEKHIEALQNEVATLKEEIQTLEYGSKQAETSMRKKQAELDRQEGSKLKLQADYFHEQSDYVEKHLFKISIGLRNACQKLGVELPSTGMGSFHTGIPKMLAVLENHLNDCFQAYAAVVEAGGADDTDILYGTGAKKDKNRSLAVLMSMIKAPTTVADEDDEQGTEDLRPLTKQECFDMADQKIQQKKAKKRG